MPDLNHNSCYRSSERQQHQHSEQLLQAVQAHWNPLRRMRIVRCPRTLPHWAISAARTEIEQLPHAKRAAYHADILRLHKIYNVMYTHWLVTLILAISLAITMVISACARPLLTAHTVILLVTVGMVVLPPLEMCRRIACNYVAAYALVVTLNTQR